ncbi:protein-disulfide reductase DsbD domain-containing protein, partial [Laribacter hongkongensis]
MKRFLCACLLFWTALCAHALTAEDLLPPERAFALSASRSGDVVRLNWAIADGYYLYRDRVSIRTEPPADIRPELPPGQLKHDPFFGETPVWRQAVEGEVRLPAGTPSPVQLVITQQGCADAGVCYPPQTIRLSLAADGRTVSAGSPAAGFLSAPPAAASPAGQPASDGSGLGSLGWGALTASFFVAG